MEAKRATAMPSASKPNAEPISVGERLAETAHETIDRMVDTSHPALDRLAERAHDTVIKVAEVAGKASDGVHKQSAQLREVQGALLEECREFVRAHPFKALLYATAAGFLLTRVLRD